MPNAAINNQRTGLGYLSQVINFSEAFKMRLTGLAAQQNRQQRFFNKNDLDFLAKQYNLNNIDIHRC